MALAASTTLVGSYVGLSKLLVATFPVFLLAWLRFGIAGVAMLPWLKRPPGEAPLSRRDRGLLFWESFLGNFLFSICMLYGVKLSGAVAAGVVMAGIPAAVAVGSWWLLRERVGTRVWAAVACVVAGVVMLAVARPAGGAGDAPASAWGFALLVGAVLCEAAYVVIGKRLTAQVGPRRISALINLWGLALVTPLGLWQAAKFDFAAVAPATWGLLVFYALAASMVTVWLWMAGLKHVPAARSGIFMVMVPVSAAAVGVVVLGEPFGLAHTLAFALALAGLLLVTWPTRPTQSARPTQPARGRDEAPTA